jgi:4-alpha-glucanotransferase
VFVARTPSRYVLAAPSDAVGDRRQPNLPGTVDEYPNWRLPVADTDGHTQLLDELLADPRVARLADELARAVR